MTMVTVMPLLGMAAVDVANRAQFKVDDATGDVQAGLALQAERLQREGVGRTADQEVAAAAAADRGIVVFARVAAGLLACANLRSRAGSWTTGSGRHSDHRGSEERQR